MTIRILLVDDEPLARSKIRAFLDPEVDFEVVGECGSGTEAISAIEDLGPRPHFACLTGRPILLGDRQKR